jgi:hypothetical protein
MTKSLHSVRGSFIFMKILAVFLIIICGVRLSAQDTASVIDRVFTTDHKVYTGQITEDKKGDYLIIDVYNVASYTINYDKIMKIQYRQDNPLYKSPEVTQSRHRDKDSSSDLVAFNGYRASSHVTDRLVRKRNLGIGLTVGGLCLAGAGAALYAVIPKQSISNSGGYLVTSPSPGAVAGILMIAGGLGITIPGAIIWAHSAHRLRLAEKDQ